MEPERNVSEQNEVEMTTIKHLSLSFSLLHETTANKFHQTAFSYSMLWEIIPRLME